MENPVAGVGEVLHASLGNVLRIGLGEFAAEVPILLAPDHEGLGVDAGEAGSEAGPDHGAIVIDHGRDGAGLRIRLGVDGEIGRREGLLHQRLVAERLQPLCIIAARGDGLREPGDLEEEHVPALEELLRVLHAGEEALRMRAIEHGEADRHLGVSHGKRPGDARAPVVTDEEGALLAAGADEVSNVFHQGAGAVRGDGFGLAGEVVAAHVGDDDAVACLRERGYLAAPGVPEFGEAVEEDDERT